MITKVVLIIYLFVVLATAIQVEKNKNVNTTVTIKKSEKRDAALISSSSKNLGYNYLHSGNSGYSSGGLNGHGGSSGYAPDSYSLHGSVPSTNYGTPFGAPWDEQTYLSSTHGGNSFSSTGNYGGSFGHGSQLGSDDLFLSSLGSHDNSLGFHGSTLGSHSSSLGSFDNYLGSHGSSIDYHGSSIGSHGSSIGSHGGSFTSSGAYGGSASSLGISSSSLGSHEVSKIYGAPSFSSHGISSTYGTPSYSSHGILNTYGTPSISYSHGGSSSFSKPSISSHGISTGHGTPTYASHGIFSSHGSPGFASFTSYKPPSISSIGLSHGDQTPVYAVGHKGLRHYTSISGSIPSHTSGSSSYNSGGSYSGGGHLSNSIGSFGYKGSSAYKAPIPKAPTHTVVITKPKTVTTAFKPSVYLGSITPDDHSGSSHSSIGSFGGHSSGYSYTAPKHQPTLSYITPQKSYHSPSYHSSPSTGYGLSSLSSGSHHGFSGEATSSTYHR